MSDSEWITTRQAAELCGQSLSAFRSFVWRTPALKAAKKDIHQVTGKAALWHRPTVIECRDQRTGRGNRTNHHDGPVSEWPNRKKRT